MSLVFVERETFEGLVYMVVSSLFNAAVILKNRPDTTVELLTDISIE